MNETLLTLSDGAQVLLRRHGRTDGPCLLVSHGTGFAVDGFARMWHPLCDRFDVIVFDLRHHGRNPPCDPMTITAERQNLDMREIVAGVGENFGRTEISGLFHSIAALAALRVETLSPGTFANLVLIEPPAPPPPDHPLHGSFEAGRLALAERSARRQARFSSLEEVAAKYQGRSAFRRFQDGAAHDLAAAIVQETAAGFELVCSPQAESRYYETNHDDGLFERAACAACPVLMLAGRDDLDHPGTPAQLGGELARLGTYDYVELANATHMMPLERPETIAALTAALIAS